MCGLFAVYCPAGIARNPAPYLDALRTQAHRGPDDEGHFLNDKVFLGFQRLSILDLSDAGHQPMTDSGGDLVLTFNGQIYNYLDLRSELQAKGHTFRSTSDTEVVLNMYMEYGADCFQRMRGMWAIVIWDARLDALVISRDRIGLKPLHVYNHNNEWVFASEAKAILAWEGRTREPDRLAAYRFVAQGWQDFTDRTFFEHIKTVPPGTVSVIRNGEAYERKFWRLEIRENQDASPELLRETYIDTIRRHLQSDVPVALALSGGVDSGSIACVLSKTLNEPGRVHAFSITPPHTDDERPWIDATVAHTGVQHTYVDTGDLDYVSLIDELLYFHDAPIPKVNQLYQYLLREWVGRHGYKVMLAGEGADETMGGYGRYAPMYLASMRALDDRESLRAFLAGAGELTGQTPKEMLNGMRRYLNTGAGARTIQMNLYGRSLFAKEAGFPEEEAFPPFHHEELPPDSDHAYFLKEMLDRFRLDIPYTLRIEDRSSMAHGVELRSPFLDHVMVETAYGFPMSAYMKNGINKHPFRVAVRDVLTPAVQAQRKKMRRPGNDSYVVYDHLADPLRDMLASHAFRDTGMWRADLAHMFENDLVERHPHKAFVWFRTYMYGRWLAMRENRLMRNGKMA